LTRVLSIQVAGQGSKQHHIGSRNSKPSRQALADNGRLSGDVINISACVNGTISLQKFLSEPEHLLGVVRLVDWGGRR
jgi:hypothetical protein